MSKLPHSSWAGVYDIAYQLSFGDFYYRLTDATLDMISSKIQPTARIVDFGAGTGRLSIPLAQKGYKVTAVEPCMEMLDELKAKDTLQGVESVCSRMQDFQSEARFDVALCVFTVILYLLDEDSLRKSMEAAHRALRPEGLLILDVPSGAIFRGYSTREHTLERTVTVTPQSGKGDIFNYRDELMVLHENGEKAYYEDEFLIRHWPCNQVMQIIQSLGFTLSEDLSSDFHGTGSHYYIFKKTEQGAVGSALTRVPQL